MKIRISPAALWMGLAIALQPAAAHADDWADAQEAFAEFDNRHGLQCLERAAQAGDLRAQRAWGLALRHAQQLFPGQLQADPEAARRWLMAAAGTAGPVKKRAQLSPL